MTSSVAAILQSGNLFTFVMNNPVGFIDPSGLRAVAINPLIGGVVTSGERQPHPMSAAASRAATARPADNLASASLTFSGSSVYKDISMVNKPGANAAARQVAEQASAMYHSMNYLQYHLSYLGNPSESIFLTAHPAFGGIMFGAVHTYVLMVATPTSPHFNTEHFVRNPLFGGSIQIATIGGESFNLTGSGLFTPTIQFDINRPGELDLTTNNFWLHLYTGSSMIDRLLEANDHFMDNHDWRLTYALFPQPVWFTGYNSNSAASGILDAVGLHPGGIDVFAPGWNVPIPSRYFRR